MKTMQRTIAYRSEASASRALYQKALRVMPGGNTRHSVALTPYPIYVRGGRGCRVTDADGEERIDFVNNFTSAILGHADPDVMEAVAAQLELGTAFSMPTRHEIDLASLLIERVGYIDQIRFCNSGTEAVMMALRAARAFTGKPKIAKVEGAYHGSYDYAQTSEAPTPDVWGSRDEPACLIEAGCVPSISRDVVILPWNDPEVCERLIQKHRTELAAVLVDPLPMRLGFIPPRPGFLQHLRATTRACNVLLISDEVLTFRLSYHGALHGSAVQPDLTTLGKIIGGGFPVGAVAGRREVMEVFDHTKEFRVHHAGTFNANPVTIRAGFATMIKMTPEAFDRLDEMGRYLRGRLEQMLHDRRCPGQVLGRGSLFAVHLTGRELIDYRSLVETSPGRAFFKDICHEMLGRGVVIPRDRLFGCLSTPMNETELDTFVQALDESLDAMQKDTG
jgi:glutamate-1-semialdehyde 2,1-aminomutase